MKSIRTFDEIGKDDAGIVGGKGASLGEMTRAGIPVPPGFVVLASAFDRFLETAGLDENIKAALREVDIEKEGSIENVSREIQSLILNAEIPEDIAQDIRERSNGLSAEYVAVRSSATAEDSPVSAWAGQLDSFLNTTGETLLENVRKCWASLFTPRAIVYRLENGLLSEKVSVAVVVQAMIQSEISGVAFSLHPVSEDGNRMLIEAGYGLGEAIVSGQITPDSYVVDKGLNKIVSRYVSLQDRGIFLKAQGGNEWNAIDESNQNRQKLSDEHILELSRLVLEIENHYGFPCDIEWTFESGKFSIVQSRPITTSAPIRKVARYKQAYTRENSLIAIEIWEKHQCELLREKLGAVVPLSLFDARDGVVKVYYHDRILDAWGDLIVRKAENDPNFVFETMREFGAFLDELEVIWKKGRVDSVQELADIFDLATRTWVGVSISYFLPSLKKVSQESQDLGMALRGRSVDFLERTDHVIQNTLHALYPNLGDLVKYLTIEEVKTGALPSTEVLMERQDHYIYFGFKLYVGKNAEEIAGENSMVILHEIVPENAKELRGQTAMAGLVQGKARVIGKKSEISMLQEGEILVTTMTTPDYVPAMRKSAAFVTDEGGVTCHAAIVAREFGKPCIIGTKIATRVLKTGDMVEVDADNGIVRVLNSEE